MLVLLLEYCFLTYKLLLVFCVVAMLHVFVLLLLVLVFYHVRYIVRLCVVTNASYVAYLFLFSFCCCCLRCPCFVLPDCWCSVLM